MGLLQKCVETYESHFEYASKSRTDCVMMAPVGHIVTRADIEITLNMNGEFVNASAVDKSEPKIIIPATEESAGRTAAPRAHPLCDKLDYLVPKNEKKYKLYVDQLSDWEASEYSHEKLKPILTYVQGGTILQDLIHSDLIQLDENGEFADEKKVFDKFIRWKVLGEGEDACWLDGTLFKAYTDYYSDSIKMREISFCMVSGKNSIPAKQHPKNIISINGNAKLISANDKTGFTYRGRFTEERQAAEVGYETSQKAHSALSWLAQEQGVILGGRTFLCWNPKGRNIVGPMNPMLRSQKLIFKPSEYREELRNALNSRKTELEINDGVIIAVLDAATDGRLSLTYYNELRGHDFLERLHDWDLSCCWSHRHFGIQSPSLRQIVDYAFGTQRAEKGQARMVTDDRILRQQMQRMIACRVDRALIGTDVVKALVNRCSSLQTYKRHDNTQREDIRGNLLFITCAVIRKYRTDRFKEEWEMALAPERRDRSYQFGRLLAIMEKVERDTYGNDEAREPNAIRMQSVFCQRPMYAANQLEKQLERAYFPRLRPGARIWYKNLIGQIMEIINSFPQEEWNKPLDDTYLMGYYLQRNDLYTKKNNNETEENENEQADE